MLPIADESGIYLVILLVSGNYRIDEPEGEGYGFGVLDGGVVDLRVAYSYSL